jgi:hypothetical protein
MRAFVTACSVAVVLAIAAAVALNRSIQGDSATVFSTTGVRLDH